MAENKTKPTKLSVAAFIDAITDPTRRADAKALVKLMQSASGEKPKMWGSSIIGFGSYHYKYDSGREGDMPLIGFSPRKAATVLYNMAAKRSSTLSLAEIQGLVPDKRARVEEFLSIGVMMRKHPDKTGFWESAGHFNPNS